MPGATRSEAQAAGHLLGGEAGHLDDLVPAAVASHQVQRRRGHPEALGEEGDQGLIGGTVHRRRGEPDPDGLSMQADDGVAGGSRLDAQRETGAEPGGRQGGHAGRPDQSIRSTTPRAIHSTSHATIGLRSIIPTGGMTRRIGSMSQSVNAMTGRIKRL